MRQVTWWLVGLAWLHVSTTPTAGAAGVFRAEDFRYLGGFRLPTYGVVVQGSWTDQFSWCKGVEAYYPHGDPGGAADGFPGSLYGVGHDWTTPMWEISIPAPVLSENVAQLPIAQILQAPRDVLAGVGYNEDLLKGIEYLPAMPGTTTPKLHISFGKHYQYNRRPTHGWLDLNLSNPRTAGPWYVGPESMVSDLNTNEYVFAIPQDWAAAHVGGQRLACGRHREGQVATGPSIIAYAPWQSGNPPPPHTVLGANPLVLYRNLSLEDGVDGHCWADAWNGAAWLRNDKKSAAIIVGMRGFGNCWYGWQDGTTPEECARWPGGCEANGYGGSNRGYYADYFRTVILFYDPRDLARVARGALTSWDVQPYLVWDITPYMIQPESTYKIHIGGVAYDEERGYLYVTERYGDTVRYKPVVHVFAVDPPRDLGGADGADPVERSVHGGGGGGAAPAPETGSLEVAVSMDRRQGVATIRVAGPAVAGPRRVSVHDVTGRMVQDLGPGRGDTLTWSTRDVSDGVFFVRVQAGDQVATRKVVVVD